jgi:hypothetical protein
MERESSRLYRRRSDVASRAGDPLEAKNEAFREAPEIGAPLFLMEIMDSILAKKAARS